MQQELSMYLNANAKSFVPENFENEMDIEIEWYESKIAEFYNVNKFIFEDDLKFIQTVNTPFERVIGDRYMERLAFKPVLSPLSEECIVE